MKQNSILKQLCEKRSLWFAIRMLGIAMLLCAGTLGARAQSGDFWENNALHWDLTDGTLTISGTGDMPDFNFDDQPWSFYKSSINTLDIQQEIISIGNNDFYGCSGLTSVSISKSVQSIASGVFQNCNKLTTIYVDVTNSAYSSENGVLFNKDKTILVCYPGGKIGNYSIPNSIQTIGNAAFASCYRLTSVTIPNSVISIGVGAFNACSSLVSITIPNSVQTISNSAFSGCNSLTAINVDAANLIYSSENGVLFNKNKTELVCFPSGKGEAGTYSIPNSVQTIGALAFQCYSGLTSVIIPNSVQTINFAAFNIANGLTDVTVSWDEPLLIDGSVFVGVPLSNVTLYVPIGSKSAYESAPVWQDFGNIVEIVTEPHYTAVSQPYPNNMTFTASIWLNGLEQQSNHLEIGAFCGNECRGSVVLQNYPESAAHPCLGFLTVHGDAGENITFKVYNHDTGKEYDARNAPVGFVADDIYGNSIAPYQITISDIITQTIPLSAGWSWISVNVANTNPSLLDQFKASIGESGVMLKSKNAYIQEPLWIGTLEELNNGEMYMVNTSAESVLSFTGLPADPAAAPVSLLNGWNWIGYSPQTSLPIDEALANLNPQDGDQIKSHSDYSVYADGAGWVGSLTTLNPGEGFKYYSTNSVTQTLAYPSSSAQSTSQSTLTGFETLLGLSKAGLRAAESGVTLKWTPNASRFANNMTLTSIVLQDNAEMQNDQIEIGAFCGEECRGSVLLKNVPQVAGHPYLGFLVVYGENNDAIRFRIYNHATGQELEADNASLPFASDAIYGDPANPFQIMTAITGISNLPTGSVTVYVENNKLNIRYPWSSIDRLEIIDLSGQILWKVNGFASESIDVSSLAQGVYLLKLVKDNQIFVYKFIK